MADFQVENVGESSNLRANSKLIRAIIHSTAISSVSPFTSRETVGCTKW